MAGPFCSRPAELNQVEECPSDLPGCPRNAAERSRYNQPLPAAAGCVLSDPGCPEGQATSHRLGNTARPRRALILLSRCWDKCDNAILPGTVPPLLHPDGALKCRSPFTAKLATPPSMPPSEQPADNPSARIAVTSSLSPATPSHCPSPHRPANPPQSKSPRPSLSHPHPFLPLPSHLPNISSARTAAKRSWPQRGNANIAARC